MNSFFGFFYNVVMIIRLEKEFCHLGGTDDFLEFFEKTLQTFELNVLSGEFDDPFLFKLLQ